MNDESKKRWLLKDRDGRVRGPFYTDEILKKISRGEFFGEEMIALYPSTDWMPISNDPEFFDQLLEALDGEQARINEEVVAPVDIPIDDEIEDEFIEKPSIPPPVKSRAERVSADNDSNKKSKSDKQNKESKKKSKSAESLPVIELQKLKKALNTAKLKKGGLPALAAGTALVGLLLFFLSDDQSYSDRIHLLAPRSNQPQLSSNQIKELSQRAVDFYIKDTYANYISAQTELIKILEGAPQNAGVIALTCLTYFELWPYAQQDSKDLYTILQVSQMASRIDPAGIESATCRAVDSLVRGRFIEAKSIVEMVLDTFGQAQNPPIAFYYLKAFLFYMSKDYESAVSYAQSAQQLWPNWLRVYSLEAKALAAAENYSQAVARYKTLLKANPNHREARIELGLIEYNHLKNYQPGEQLLETALNMEEKAPREVVSRGYLGLAEIALRQKNQSRALSLAQKAYQQNSSNVRAKEMIVSIGGQGKLKKSLVDDQMLTYEGDQLVREGDCAAAQAVYKTAYEINKKNSLAAIKAAECLWKLSLSSEAIQWLHRAIKSDPKFIDAYVVLADYYSQRFDFESAGKILVKARSQDQKSYKVFRGLALVELRRNNPKGVILYAERATQIYEADVESYVLLAQAHLLVGAFAKAFETASKAIEIDLNNQSAQVAYAKALAGTRGIHVGIDYLLRLVNTYPTITDYRMALGDMYMKDQRYSSAQEAYEQVTRIEDKPKKALIGLGLALQAQKQYNLAKDAFIQAAQLDPADVEALFLAGQLYLEAKQPSEARQQFQRVLRVNKEYPLVNYYIGVAALQMGSAEEAIEQAKLEKAKNPNLAEPYLLAADAYTELKQYSSCAGEYLYAVKLSAVNSDLYVKMARCYRLAGNLDAAVSMINQASFQESGNPEVWKEQGSIYEMRQEKVKAIEAYNQYLVLAPNAADREQIEDRIDSLSR